MKISKNLYKGKKEGLYVLLRDKGSRNQMNQI